MKTLRLIFGLAILIFMHQACIDALDRETDIAAKLLVVEGNISTGPGPHLVKLSRSAKYGSIIDDSVQPESRATVTFRDETGEVELLEEDRDGEYYTSTDFSAQVGKTYTLQVTLADGTEYISNPEKILPVAPVESLIAEFVEEPTIPGEESVSGIEIYARWNDPEDEQNFYLWQANGTYVIDTRPDLFREVTQWGSFEAPKDCCARCYVTEKNLNQIAIFKDNLTNGLENFEQVAFVQDNGRRISERYMVAFEQRSISKEAFQFFNILQNQLSIDGDIFDPPPAIVRSNMINLSNPDEDVIGFFYVSDVHLDTIYINNADLTLPKPNDVLNDDCREIFGNNVFSTVDRPEWWRD